MMHKHCKNAVTQENWSKAKREALKRYHPDKFESLYSKMMNPIDRIRIMSFVNEICQWVSKMFNVVSNS